jgi:transcriptional regulator with XRE-family HTH domain
MWLDRLKELKNKSKLSCKDISDQALCSERTVTRIFSGENEHPNIDTIAKIAKVLGSSLEDVFSETKMVIGDQDLATIQEKLSIVAAENEMLTAENAVLKDRVSTLVAETNLMTLQLKHKDEIIALHNYYNKLKTKDENILS